jgi:hypothetical protein
MSDLSVVAEFASLTDHLRPSLCIVVIADLGVVRYLHNLSVTVLGHYVDHPWEALTLRDCAPTVAL